MTNKICKKCGTFTPDGQFCPQCGTQLYPDIGQTIWLEHTEYLRTQDTLKRCEHPDFDVWTGKKVASATGGESDWSNRRDEG